MRPVSLETLHNGVVIDMFNEELSKVLANIADENTKPDAVRQITLKVTIKPDKSRQGAATAVDVTSRLCPVQPSTGMMFFRRGGRRTEAYEDDYRQKELEDKDGNVIYTMPKTKEV